MKKKNNAVVFFSIHKCAICARSDYVCVIILFGLSYHSRM